MGHDPNQNKHCFDETHPPKIVRYSNYKKWIQSFEKAVPYISAKVYNATVNTNLHCFERVNLREII